MVLGRGSPISSKLLELPAFYKMAFSVGLNVTMLSGFIKGLKDTTPNGDALTTIYKDATFKRTFK